MRYAKPVRPGVVLISVFVITSVLLLVAYQYLNLISEEYTASVAGSKLAQSRYLADSGMHYGAFCASYPGTAGLQDNVTDNPLVWLPSAYDNPGVFRDRPVNGPTNVKGYFSIVSFREMDDPEYGSTPYRFGFEDEGGKININALRKLVAKGTVQEDVVKSILAAVPGGSPEVVAAIFNWTAPGGTPDSAEESYYNSLGYSSKGGPFESLEEMLLVQGVTPTFLFGNDRNRNGRLDPEENQAGGVLDRGWQRYLTVYSRELNLDSQGQPRINLTETTDMKTLHSQLVTALGDELGTFVTLSLVSTPQSLTSSSAPAPPAGVDVTEDGKIVISKPEELKAASGGGTKSMLNLVDKKFTFRKTVPGTNPPKVLTGIIEPPMPMADKDKLRTTLPLLWDKCTYEADLELPAKININTMPPDAMKNVLETLGATETFTETLLSVRPSAGMDPSLIPVYRSPAWLITEANAELPYALLLEPYFTAYSQVYRFQVVGYTDRRGPVTRLEAVVDANQGRPRILFWRDISELGRGFDFTRKIGQ